MIPYHVKFRIVADMIKNKVCEYLSSYVVCDCFDRINRDGNLC
jgi:hypothetical protein